MLQSPYQPTEAPTMQCPRCHSKSTVSQTKSNGTTRRRRNCVNHECRHIFHTAEVEVAACEHGGDRHSALFHAGIADPRQQDLLA